MASSRAQSNTHTQGRACLATGRTCVRCTGEQARTHQHAHPRALRAQFRPAARDVCAPHKDSGLVRAARGGRAPGTTTQQRARNRSGKIMFQHSLSLCWRRRRPHLARVFVPALVSISKRSVPYARALVETKIQLPPSNCRVGAPNVGLCRRSLCRCHWRRPMRNMRRPRRLTNPIGAR